MKATPKQWDESGSFASDTRACLLELRSRVEALEAGTSCPHVVTSDEGTSYCNLAVNTQDKLDRLIEMDHAAPAPASSLVDKVALKIAHKDCFLPTEVYGEDARAAIREVAAWLRDRNGYPWAWVAQILELEVDR